MVPRSHGFDKRPVRGGCCAWTPRLPARNLATSARKSASELLSDYLPCLIG